MARKRSKATLDGLRLRDAPRGRPQPKLSPERATHGEGPDGLSKEAYGLYAGRENKREVGQRVAKAASMVAYLRELGAI